MIEDRYEQRAGPARPGTGPYGPRATGPCLHRPPCLSDGPRPWADFQAGPGRKARGPIVLWAVPWPAIWKIPNLIQNLTKHNYITFKSQILILHNSHNTMYSQIIFHLPKVTSFTSHRTWYFKFHKFPNTGPLPCLLLKGVGPSTARYVLRAGPNHCALGRAFSPRAACSTLIKDNRDLAACLLLQ